MTLNDKECKYIIKPIVKSGITNAGICSTLHTAVRYGTIYLGGIEQFYFFIIQEARRIAFLIKHYI